MHLTGVPGFQSADSGFSRPHKKRGPVWPLVWALGKLLFSDATASSSAKVQNTRRISGGSNKESGDETPVQFDSQQEPRFQICSSFGEENNFPLPSRKPHAKHNSKQQKLGTCGSTLVAVPAEDKQTYPSHRLSKKVICKQKISFQRVCK